jgi:hypothetical protein
VLIEKDLTTSQTEINISTLSNGIYFVKTIMGGKTKGANLKYIFADFFVDFQ